LVGDQYFFSTFIPPLLSRPFNFYLKWIENFFNKKYTPEYLGICVTNDCPNNCEFCSNKSAPKGKETSLEEIIKTVEFFKSKGISKVGLTGGEPLLRSDLPEIISEINKKDLFIALCTSGYGLSLQKAKELREASKLMLMKIGLDFGDEETNDRGKNRRGAFNDAVEAIKNSLEVGFCVIVETVLSRKMINSPEIFFKFVDLLEGLGVHELQFLEPKPSGAYFSAEYAVGLSAAEKQRFYELAKQVNHSRRKIKCSSFFELEDKLVGCMGGLGNFYLDAIGNLCPCAFWSYPVGNIRESSLEEIFSRFNARFKSPKGRCSALASAAERFIMEK